jgi:hypothetical protein
MGLSYYDLERKPRAFLAKVWVAANALIAFGMLFYWSGLVRYVGDPYRWAMQSGVSAHPSLFETSYLLLWATPVLCMLMGWFAMRMKQYSIARIVGCYPSFMLALMIGWYNLAPQHWL